MKKTFKQAFQIIGLCLSGVTVISCSQESAPASKPLSEVKSTVTSPLLLSQINDLRAEVESAEDLSAIKRLQKAYGYYLDKGMWTDLAALFADDAVANYPAGVYEGRDSITRHLYLNVGAVEMGEVGLGDGRLYNHMNMQPVVHVNAGNKTAKGRWRAMAMFGRFGAGPGIWAEGIYNIGYVQEEGIWKIQSLDYTPGYGNTYTDGWGGADPDAPQRIRNRSLPHPPDRVVEDQCSGFPDACIAPFHYQNLGTSSDSNIWQSAEFVTISSGAGAQEIDEHEVAELLHRAQLLKDETEVENLQRIFAYYLDRALWDQVADLFVEEGSIEYAQMGVYTGKSRVRDFLGLFGEQGIVDGWLFDHVQLQTIADIAQDGLSAKVRSREWGMTGHYQEEGSGRWHDGIYENTFVKQEGVWKIQAIHYYPTYITDYDLGWTLDAKPAPSVSATLPPDFPPTEVYEIYPQAHIPPYHYLNPVTGTVPVYPLGAESNAAFDFNNSMIKQPVVNDIDAALVQAQSLVQQVKDHHELENLENAYGYYLDKNLWNELADLFSEEGSMELAQRGVYQGRERVRDFLFNVFGGEGPVEGRLGNHLHMQPVIHIDADGQGAQIRSRMMQQLNFTGRASMGAAIYINEAIKEDGRWKFLSTHAFNTFTASYHGGWVENPGTRLPGMSEDFPPDFPPTVEFSMFPTVYEIPFSYSNPVSGRN